MTKLRQRREAALTDRMDRLAERLAELEAQPATSPGIARHPTIPIPPRDLEAERRLRLAVTNPNAHSEAIAPRTGTPEGDRE